MRSALLLLALATLASEGRGAPAPLPPPRPSTWQLAPEDMIGHWAVTWAAGEYEVWFYPDGQYLMMSRFDVCFRGSWAVSKEGLLWATELKDDSPESSRWAWLAPLRRDRDGKFSRTYLTGKLGAVPFGQRVSVAYSQDIPVTFTWKGKR